jgi:hypothetical protein
MQLHIGLLLYGIQKQLVQIGPVNGGVGCAIARARALTQAQTPQLFPAGRRPHTQHLGKCRSLLERICQTPAVKDTHYIGAKLDTSPNFPKLVGSLQQLNRPVRAGACQCRRQPTNAAANNQNLFFHGDIVARKTLPISLVARCGTIGA